MDSSDPLLDSIPSARVVGCRGRPVARSVSGHWTAAPFIIGAETAERSAYFGMSLNLITYLTDRLGQPTAKAAAFVNTWAGLVFMAPLLGAFVADSCIGRFATVVIASVLYVLGLGVLTLSAAVPTIEPRFQAALFYISLIIIAFAQGGFQPALQAFGGDQFDENNPRERIARSSFFNWWFFGMNIGPVASLLVLPYVQDNIGWGLGFGIPCILMAVAASVFLMGARTYRYFPLEDRSSYARIGRAFVAIARNGGANSSASAASPLIISVDNENLQSVEEDDGAPSVAQIKEARAVLRLFPIWTSCVTYAIVLSQSSTFFTKQGCSMDRRIGSSFQVPPAALQSLSFAAGAAFIPIYDRILIPIVRKYTKTPSGFTLLQRIGTGLVLTVVLMIVAALVETRRLNTAREFDLIDRPDATVPMSLWWLVPQYVLLGVTDAFVVVGLQEFFYDQVPDMLRSLGAALFLSILGTGRFVSGLLVTVIDEVTRRAGESWFSDDLNRAHLDYFYWFLAGISTGGFVVYLLCARAYVYKTKLNAAPR